MESFYERPPWLCPQNLSHRVNKMEGETETMGGKRNPWMTHLKKTMRANKGKSLGQVMKIAKKTYKKTAKRGGALAPMPLKGGKKGTRKSQSRKSLKPLY